MEAVEPQDAHTEVGVLSTAQHSTGQTGVGSQAVKALPVTSTASSKLLLVSQPVGRSLLARLLVMEDGKAARHARGSNGVQCKDVDSQNVNPSLAPLQRKPHYFIFLMYLNETTVTTATTSTLFFFLPCC
jgi:hypothetical protein